MFFDEHQYSLQVMLLQPVNNKAIGCEEPQDVAVIHGLQRANPGVELLLGKLRLKDAEALVP